MYQSGQHSVTQERVHQDQVYSYIIAVIVSVWRAIVKPLLFLLI